MTRSTFRNGALALLGAATLVVDLRLAPVAATVALALFAGVFWLILRRQVEQHRRTRRHHLRRQLGTAALVSSGAWIVLSLVRALRDGFSGAEDAVREGGELVAAPWPGTFLVAGLVAIAAATLVLATTVVTRRRHSAQRTSAQSSAAGGSR